MQTHLNKCRHKDNDDNNSDFFLSCKTTAITTSVPFYHINEAKQKTFNCYYCAEYKVEKMDRNREKKIKVFSTLLLINEMKLI